jgi:adenylate kinase family enzyme
MPEYLGWADKIVFDFHGYPENGRICLYDDSAFRKDTPGHQGKIALREMAGLRRPQRIVILGCAGTGKTVFARRVAERLAVPVICLDEMLQRSGAADDWPAFRARVAEAHAREAWVSDGNFAQVSFDLRLPRSELIIWLERPRILCTWSVCMRVFRPGEAHKLRNLSAVLKFIWNFDRVNRPIIEAQRAAHGMNVPVVHMRNRGAMTEFLETLAG